ncbi:MAG: alpha/beta hydrolase [Nitrolancea sp.]
MQFPSTFSDRKVATNGIELRVVMGTDEQKPPLLMLHGIYHRAESWLPVAERLAKSYRLIMPDLRGHYRSDWPETGYELPDYAADAAGLLDSLGIDQAFVLGHSLGAMIAMVLSGQHPDRVRALVLEDPPSERSNDTRTWLGALLSAKRATAEQTYVAIQGIHPERTEEDWRRETDWLRATGDGPFLALIEATGGEPESFEAAMQRISSRTRMLQADPRQGGALSTEAGRRATEGRDDRKLVRFPETGHLIHMERPEKFVKSVEEFLGDA